MSCVVFIFDLIACPHAVHTAAAGGGGGFTMAQLLAGQGQFADVVKVRRSNSGGLRAVGVV